MDFIRMLLVLFVQKMTQSELIIGYEPDEFGCNSAAGYLYCNHTDNCIHVTELCHAIS
jgi:hypothetical protein